MEFNGKVLIPEYSDVLVEATRIRNQFYKARDAQAVDITPEAYLEEMILRQIEGLIPAVEAEKALEASRIALQSRVMERTKFDR